jgi:hypothetical protein
MSRRLTSRIFVWTAVLLMLHEGPSVVTIAVPNGALAGAPTAGWFGLVSLALALAGAGALRIRRRGI